MSDSVRKAAVVEGGEDAPEVDSEHCSLLRLSAAVLCHGVGTGLIGVFIATLIRQVQELGYGDNENGGFLEIAVQAPPLRRFSAVLIAGMIGALSWYWLRGQEKIIVTVEDGVKGAKMPPLITTLNGIVQDVVVALGGSFGREAAPREIAAMWGGLVADALGVVQPSDRKILVACGAGAGLAAVYAVPISGTLYTLEHVLDWELSWRGCVCALVTSCIATVVGSIVVEDAGLYEMDEKYSYGWPSSQMIGWAVLAGPLVGLGALCFRWLVKWFEKFKPPPREKVCFSSIEIDDRIWVYRREGDFEVRRPAQVLDKSKTTVTIEIEGDSYSEEIDENILEKTYHPEGPRSTRILVLMPAAFFFLALLSWKFPSLLGNGRAMAEVAINRDRSLPFFIMLLFFKAFMTAAAIGSGAAGGTLTPSVALGATLGAIVGEFLQIVVPQIAPQNSNDDEMSVVSAAGFLAIMLRSPVTSVWLMIEFSAQGMRISDLTDLLLHADPSGILRSKLLVGMLVPISICVAGAVWTTKLVNSTLEAREAKAIAENRTKPPLLALTRTDKRFHTRSRAWTFDLDLVERHKRDPMAYEPITAQRAISAIPESSPRMSPLESPSMTPSPTWSSAATPTANRTLERPLSKLAPLTPKQKGSPALRPKFFAAMGLGDQNEEKGEKEEGPWDGLRGSGDSTTTTGTAGTTGSQGSGSGAAGATLSATSGGGGSDVEGGQRTSTGPGTGPSETLLSAAATADAPLLAPGPHRPRWSTT